MLLEFKFRNFLSFQNETTINFTSIDYYDEHKETHTFPSGKKEISLLKSIFVYGSNGGGKSNLVKALAMMNNIIHNSFKDSLTKDESRPVWDFFYKLNTDTITKPTMFEVSILIDNIIYTYGFEINHWKIVSEWLYKTDQRQTLLFERVGQDFKINSKGFPEGKKFKQVNENVLFLSYLAQFNEKEAWKIFSFFKKINLMDGLEHDRVKHVTHNLIKEGDENFKNWLGKAIQFLEISSISVSNKDTLLTQHPIYNDQNNLTGFANFDLELDESEGTKKVIFLLGAIYDTLLYGKIFWIDEFDSKLHPNLIRKLVSLFHEFNLNKSQLLLTVHDPILLDKEIIRRDQILFVDKNQFGASDAYPMSNFKSTDGLRSLSDFKKKYLDNDFGAAETIRFNEEFIALTKKILAS